MDEEQFPTRADEVSILGRKVFFINPPSIVRSYIIRVLREKEYEAYLIDNYRDAKPILHHNRNSICFVNVDTQLSRDAWIAFLETFQHDPVLRTVILGVVSKKVSQEDERAYFNNLVINAGILTVAGTSEEIFDKVKEILDANGAMGTRRNIRVTCPELGCKMYWVHNKTKMFKMKIVDISTVSVAVVLPPELDKRIHVRDVLEGAILSLNGRQFTVGLIVYTLRDSPAGTIAIFKIGDASLAEMKVQLKNHIYMMLDNNINSIMNHSFQDETDYTMIAEQNRDIKMRIAAENQAKAAKEAQEESENFDNSQKKDDKDINPLDPLGLLGLSNSKDEEDTEEETEDTEDESSDSSESKESADSSDSNDSEQDVSDSDDTDKEASE